MDAELIFWIVALVVSIILAGFVWATPSDLYASKETIDQILEDGRNL